METLDIADILSVRARGVESSGIRKVFDLAAKLTDPINFSIGQPDFPVPDVVRVAAIRAIEDGKNRYTPTQGIEALRIRVMRKLREANGIVAPLDDVLITSGSSGGIFLSLASILNPGDEIVVPDPYFVMYPQLAEFFGAKPVYVDTYPDFQIDPDRIARAITPRTKAIILNSPTNPTGAVIPESTLRAIAAIADRHGVLVISDEVYEAFVYDGTKHFSIGSIYPRTLTLNALSKSYAATGWRIGYAVGPRALIDKMKELQQYTFVCAPSFAQEAAICAFDVDMSAAVAQYQRRRDLVYEGLKDRFEVAKPQGAFYIMPKVDASDANAFVERAIENNILIIPGGVFSTRSTHVRMSYAIPEERIREGIEILRRL